MQAAWRPADLASRLPGLAQLWSRTRGEPEIKIAVLDGPVDAGATFVSELSLSGVIQHGTMVASILTGARDRTSRGLAPGCTVMSIPIFERNESNASVCSQATLAKAIRAACDNGANIINISASQQTNLLGLDTELSAAVQKARADDILVVAAVGNQGCACDTIPSSIPGVLAVGAHDVEGKPLKHSNWGPGHRVDGLLAPGDAIPGACVDGGICHGTGTSFATAIVSGVAALLMSAQLKMGHTPSGEWVRKVLLRSCDPCEPELQETCGPFLAGRLNVGRTLDLLASSSDSVVTQEGSSMTDANGAHHVSLAPSPLLSPSDTPQQVQAASLDNGRRETLDLGVELAGCGCGCSGKADGHCDCERSRMSSSKAPAQLVYAIGRLGVSFVNQARRDSIWRSIHNVPTRGAVEARSRTPEIDLKPLTNTELLELVRREPWQAQSVVWVLSRTEVPMYAIVPAGAFAAETYNWLVDEWADQEVEFVSVPGVIAGQISLYDGMTVDAVIPDLRGMYSWSRKRYIGALTERLEGEGGDTAKQIERFLSKIEFRVRNKGLSPEERAINATATNAFNFSDVIVEAGAEGYALQDISVEKSPVNRPNSAYYDVLLTFFDPRDRLARSKLQARFTVDVTDTVPVVVGTPDVWYEY